MIIGLLVGGIVIGRFLYKQIVVVGGRSEGIALVFGGEAAVDLLLFFVVLATLEVVVVRVLLFLLLLLGNLF